MYDLSIYECIERDAYMSILSACVFRRACHMRLSIQHCRLSCGTPLCLPGHPLQASPTPPSALLSLGPPYADKGSHSISVAHGFKNVIGPSLEGEVISLWLHRKLSMFPGREFICDVDLYIPRDNCTSGV